MQRKIICSLLLCLLLFPIMAQEQYFKGYPSRDGNIDIRENFFNPPKGYGNVPFYWWNGDSLNQERLLDQLNTLSGASIDGFAVSYIHSHPKVDVDLNMGGYGGFGKPDPGVPGVFTDEWWKTWNWFSGKCADVGLGLGLDDYVVGWANNGYYVDELCNDDKFSNYQGRLKFNKYIVKPDTILQIELKKQPLSVMLYPEGINLMDKIKNNRLVWRTTSDKEQKLYVIYTDASYELHPEYGKRLVEVYFKRFEDKLDERGRKGLNYFFQDELHYNLNIHSWAEDMTEEFLRRKGYDIQPYLPALFDDIGDVTPKIRLDYADVVTQLSEERYFKPIFEWHSNRGLIYGCDNNGRGLEPLQYLDYFRMTSWFTAPGNDAPARGSSFRQTKVSSSITHLYERPRTWLEAFHSMGWDSNGEWLTSQLDHHMIAGGNLLCLHGLYYSTHGGWWEWAPPCFHFRMPYWPHMKKWLKYAERLSFLLSQGTHVCDIAVMYPTESLQAYPGTNPEVMWQVTDQLSECGLDYDYIDFHSLQNADTENGILSIAGENYKVLVLADIKAMHYKTLLKILDFYRKGGIVIATGSLLEATSHAGENDPELKKILDEIFGSKEGKGIYESDSKKVAKLISELIIPDFKVSTGKGKVLHRKIGMHDIYMIMNVDKDSEVFFRAKGSVECWNAKDGSITVQPILRETEEGTWIKFDGEYNVSKLLVFSPGKPVYETKFDKQWRKSEEIPIVGEWAIDIIPTMNNKWGDFRLPAMDEFIGPEAREFIYSHISSSKGDKKLPELALDTLTGIYGYAPYMETITLDNTVNLQKYLTGDQKGIVWKPYCYSWQYGVYDNPGGQGYHGLKGKVDNRFIILDQGGHQLFRTYVYAPQDGEYCIEQEGETPDYIYVDGISIQTRALHMSEGWHRVLLAYANTTKGDYILPEKKSYSVDERKRSAVVFYKKGHSVLKDNDPYGHIIATKWHKSQHLPYSIVADKGLWKYQFKTAPGTSRMNLEVKGEILKMWVDGKAVKKKNLKNKEGNKYTIDMIESTPGISVVRVLAKPDKGYDGPAFFVEPIKLTCGKGNIPVGNWTNFGALKYFSGGIKYTKNINITSSMKDRMELDLGIVDATCEVRVNKKMVNVLMNSPFKVDVTEYLKQGKNEIEVLVYSTLSNHYQTIPSAYRGEPRAGLIGPVKIVGWNKE